MKLGILNIAFNRPEYFKQVLAALDKQNIPKGSLYMCYIDGARVYSDNDGIEKNKALASAFMERKRNDGTFETSAYVVREKNYFCDKNIVLAIDQFIQAVDAIVVIEEDIVVKKGFMEWMLWGIKNLVHMGKCQSILAHSEPKSNKEDPAAYYTENWFTPWGWATTKTAWNNVFHSWAVMLKDASGIDVVTKAILDAHPDKKSSFCKYSADGKLVQFPSGWDYMCNITYGLLGLKEAAPIVPRCQNVGKHGAHQDGVTQWPELAPRKTTSDDYDIPTDFHEVPK